MAQQRTTTSILRTLQSPPILRRVPRTPPCPILYRRAMHSSPKSQTSEIPEPRALNDLVKSWQHVGEPKRLERSYKFKDFNQAWSFMSAVAARCEEVKHHPEWSNVYNTVFIRWTTHHNQSGVRKKDRIMATVCDALATQHGGEGVGGADHGELANKAGEVSGNCCVPEGGQTGKEKEKEKIESEEIDEGKQGSVAGIGGQPS